MGLAEAFYPHVLDAAELSHDTWEATFETTVARYLLQHRNTTVTFVQLVALQHNGALLLENGFTYGAKICCILRGATAVIQPAFYCCMFHRWSSFFQLILACHINSDLEESPLEVGDEGVDDEAPG